MSNKILPYHTILVIQYVHSLLSQLDVIITAYGYSRLYTKAFTLIEITVLQTVYRLYSIPFDQIDVWVCNLYCNPLCLCFNLVIVEHSH